MCDLRTLVLGFPVTALYFYPGAELSPDDGEDALQADAAEHRAFRDHLDDFLGRNYRPIGVSSESRREQQTSIVANGLQHLLLSDPDLTVARELDLPTYQHDKAERYRRLTLVVINGAVAKWFFPIGHAERNAAQVLGWLQVQGL